MSDKWKYALRETFIHSPWIFHIMILVLYGNLTLVISAFVYKDLFCIESILNGVIGYVVCYLIFIRNRIKEFRYIQDRNDWTRLIEEHFERDRQLRLEEERRRQGDYYINSIDDLYE